MHLSCPPFFSHDCSLEPNSPNLEQLQEVGLRGPGTVQFQIQPRLLLPRLVTNNSCFISPLLRKLLLPIFLSITLLLVGEIHEAVNVDRKMRDAHQPPSAHCHLLCKTDLLSNIILIKLLEITNCANTHCLSYFCLFYYGVLLFKIQTSRNLFDVSFRLSDNKGKNFKKFTAFLLSPLPMPSLYY